MQSLETSDTLTSSSILLTQRVVHIKPPVGHGVIMSAANYENDIYLFPKKLVEKVVKLYLPAHVAFLIVPTQIKQMMQVSRL